MQLGSEVIELTDYLTRGKIPLTRAVMTTGFSTLRSLSVTWTKPTNACASTKSNIHLHLSAFLTGTKQQLEFALSTSRTQTVITWKLLTFHREKAIQNGSALLINYFRIDHTAIVVANTEASLKFYRDLLGLKLAGESENYGTEHLNNVFGARLQISSLRAPVGPGIEFLEYLTPRDGRPFQQMPTATICCIGKTTW